MIKDMRERRAFTERRACSVTFCIEENMLKNILRKDRIMLKTFCIAYSSIHFGFLP